MQTALRYLVASWLLVFFWHASNATAQKLTATPYHDNGIYDVGQTVGWNLSAAEGEAPSGEVSYTIKKNNASVLKSGTLDFASGKATIETSLDEPGMLYVEVKLPAEQSGEDSGAAKKNKLVLGAAVAPTKIQSSVPAPKDFDDFWIAKIKELKDVPENAVLTPGENGSPDVEYSTITMDHVGGTHVHGQLAKPAKEGKFPALAIFQWASPPYPLQKSWVVDRARQGWLVLNIEPHDVLPDQPKEYYDSLPQAVKKNESIGNNDREKSYFVRMYLADYRAVDYLASRPDWDGKTLVVMGTSMGGQQSLCVAGLHPRITHLIANEPGGCDLNAALHGRQAGYPFFPSGDPKILETAQYVDAVNFASHIRARALLAEGFVDTICPPAGIFAAFNQIQAAKEAAPMIDSPHNNTATTAQQRPFTQRSEEWLKSLVKGEQVTPNLNWAGSNGAAPVASPRFDDHQNMMNQLGVKKLRRGADPNNQGAFDEATANPYKDSMPDALTMKDGTKVTSAEQWPQRRAEIAEDFEREVYGRIPKNVPGVKWEVTDTTEGISGTIPTVTKTLVGHVDNHEFPAITVDIQASFTVPKGATGAVPMMIEFRGFGLRRGPLGGSSGPPQRAGVTPWTEQAIAKGWGYGSINPGSIQSDNNQLRTGIVGLANKGEPRKPDDWGALRAWQWGVSRLIDYFEANPDSKVDPKKVGIAGLSRYGKAAIVTQAFDERIAVGLIGSSGEGGVKLHRHIFGEAVENLTGGEYYWMAGNFIKYGASEPEKTAADLPVDSHELIALCAPRPCFISYGVPEKGDAPWVDAHGSFMAGVLAGPVYRLLGKKDFGTPGDYLNDAMPAVGTLIGGELAWRQHEGGHDLTPNWPAFFEWVGNYIQAPPLPKPAVEKPAASEPFYPADQAWPRSDANSKLAHEQLIDKAKQGGIDVYFVGDSITRRWGSSDPQYKSQLANWNQNFFGWNAANFGWGGDVTQNILWRLKNGELDGVNPKVIVVLAGTNNVGTTPGDEKKIANVTNGVKAIVDVCRAKAPDATVILTAIFPRNDSMAVMPTINAINERLEKLADGKQVRYLNVNDKLADADGKLFDGMMADKLHPAVKGYQVWADGLKPILTELLGPPAETDHAPPPTGDPSAAKPAPAEVK